MEKSIKVAFLYEHPVWSERLIQCFQTNDIALKLLNVDEVTFDTGRLDVDYGLLINRVNIMPYKQRDPSIVFHTLHFLHWLALTGVRIINGARAHYVGASKALQNGIFAKLGLDFPQAIAIYKVQDALAASKKVGYPLIVKPNIGGSGSGIAKYSNADDLRKDIISGTLALGVDHSGLVQEYIESDGYVYRIEILGDELFYAIRQKMVANQFNYCAADGCHVGSAQAEQDREFDFCVIDAPAPIERFEPQEDTVAQARSILREANADVGGVEFMLNRKTSRPCFYDFNPYSNFISHGEQLLGFSPEQRYVDFIKTKLV